ncbi:MAG: IPT/TIG domain-containing protein, partial [Acidobacteria bacterium]|nr:IPT/TIG domain-containing protein [Acidobacteriota bacterium]
MRAVRLLAWLTCVLAAFAAAAVANTEPPVVNLPEPVLTITKDPGTGDVVLQWSVTAGPYAAVRSGSPRFANGTEAVVGAGIPGTELRDPVLNDGVTYFYLLDDGNAPPRAVSLSALSALAGESITLTGTGFDTSSLTANRVFVGGAEATVTNVTDSTITFSVPTQAFTGFVLSVNDKGAAASRTRLTRVATSGLAAISSLGIDRAGTLFLADTGTAGTSDRVFTFNPGTGARTQVGFLGEAVLGVSDTADDMYYGNSTVSTANYGSIRRTDSTGAESTYRSCGNSGTGDNCYVFGIGIDPTLTDYDPAGRVYVVDGVRVPESFAGPIPVSLAGPRVPGTTPRLSPRRRPSVRGEGRDD